MLVRHTLTIRAKCPMDNGNDKYEAEFTATRVVPVETILAAVKRMTRKTIFQEDLTAALARELGMEVRTVGYHSGVRTEVTA